MQSQQITPNPIQFCYKNIYDHLNFLHKQFITSNSFNTQEGTLNTLIQSLNASITIESFLSILYNIQCYGKNQEAEKIKQYADEVLGLLVPFLNQNLGEKLLDKIGENIINDPTQYTYITYHQIRFSQENNTADMLAEQKSLNEIFSYKPKKQCYITEFYKKEKTVVQNNESGKGTVLRNSVSSANLKSCLEDIFNKLNNDSPSVASNDSPSVANNINGFIAGGMGEQKNLPYVLNSPSPKK